MEFIGYDVCPRRGRPWKGHTLVELVTVVLILSILACVAVPRLNFAAANGVRADAVVQQIVTALRRARAQAILHAAENPAGYALVMNGGTPYVGYQILSLRDSTVIVGHEIPDDVVCGGGQRFAFGPLGNLLGGSDTELRVAAQRRVYSIQVEPATGAVKWIRHND